MAKNIRFETKIPKFDTKIEQEMHQIVSRIHYGERIEIPVINLSTLDEKLIRKAIEKSAKWNCIDLHIRWAKDRTHIKIGVE